MSDKIKKYPQIGLIYSHYKGGMYEPLFISTHTETGEQLINYKSVHFGSYHSRPLEMWFEEVTYTNESGEKFLIPRFYPYGEAVTLKPIN